MISSLETHLSLLNKWKSDETEICVVFRADTIRLGGPTPSFCFSGKIVNVSNESLEVRTGDKEEVTISALFDLKGSKDWESLPLAKVPVPARQRLKGRVSNTLVFRLTSGNTVTLGEIRG
jgi:hypothetical protein